MLLNYSHTNVSAEAHGTLAVAVPPALNKSKMSGMKLSDPTIKLDMFNGSSCMDTFLAKFKNIALYLGWSERDRYYAHA